MADDARTYVRIHDGMPDHPKMLEVGGQAGWLWICGLCYSARYLTDGRIPKSVVPRLTDLAEPVALAGRLCEVGLWVEHEKWYEIHDYSAHQRTAAEVADLKAKRAEAGRKGGKAKAQRQHLPGLEASNGLASASEDAKQFGKQTGSKDVAETETQLSTSILKQPSVVALDEPATVSEDGRDADLPPPPRASRDDRLRRAEAACDLLGDQAHAAAVARGVVLRPEAHLKACRQSARTDYLATAQLVAFEQPALARDLLAAEVLARTEQQRYPQIVDNSESEAGDLYLAADDKRRARQATEPAQQDRKINRRGIQSARNTLTNGNPDHGQ